MNPDDGTPGCRDCGRETLLAAVLEGDGVDYVQLDAADVERATLKDPGEPLYAITGRRHADPLAAITSSARGRRAHRASCRSLAWLRAFTNPMTPPTARSAA